MERGIAILLSLCALVTLAYFTASKWAIRHRTITFIDPSRDNRPVAVDVAVRRDKAGRCRHARAAGRDPQSRQYGQVHRMLLPRQRIRGPRLSCCQYPA